MARRNQAERSCDDLSALSVAVLLDLWPGSIEGELTRRAVARGMRRSEYVKSVLTAAEVSPTHQCAPSKAKLRIVFAKRGEGLRFEALDYLREHKRFPEFRLISTSLELAVCEAAAHFNPRYVDLTSEQLRVFRELRDRVQKLRGQGLA